MFKLSKFYAFTGQKLAQLGGKNSTSALAMLAAFCVSAPCSKEDLRGVKKAKASQFKEKCTSGIIPSNQCAPAHFEGHIQNPDLRLETHNISILLLPLDPYKSSACKLGQTRLNIIKLPFSCSPILLKCAYPNPPVLIHTKGRIPKEEYVLWIILSDKTHFLTVPITSFRFESAFDAII